MRHAESALDFGHLITRRRTWLFMRRKNGIHHVTRAGWRTGGKAAKGGSASAETVTETVAACAPWAESNLAHGRTRHGPVKDCIRAKRFAGKKQHLNLSKNIRNNAASFLSPSSHHHQHAHHPHPHHHHEHHLRHQQQQAAEWIKLKPGQVCGQWYAQNTCVYLIYMCVCVRMYNVRTDEWMYVHACVTPHPDKWHMKR